MVSKVGSKIHGIHQASPAKRVEDARISRCAAEVLNRAAPTGSPDRRPASRPTPKMQERIKDIQRIYGGAILSPKEPIRKKPEEKGEGLSPWALKLALDAATDGRPNRYDSVEGDSKSFASSTTAESSPKGDRSVVIDDMGHEDVLKALEKGVVVGIRPRYDD
jgi:hypothetical protein